MMFFVISVGELPPPVGGKTIYPSWSCVTLPPPPPPPLLVPVVCTPADVKKILPDATSDAVAVVGVTSVKDAVPPPCLGTVKDGTAEYTAPQRETFCDMMSPPYEIESTFVTESCDITGICADPLTPKMVLPETMFADTKFASPLMVCVPVR